MDNIRNMASIGIVGYGRVGKAVEYGFKNGNSILCYDKYPDSISLKKISSLEKVVKDSEFIFVCVPTPYREGERGYPIIDLSIMDENIREIAGIARGSDRIVIIKSTVVPGTTRGYGKKYSNVNFCFNPEFLTEANYLEDFVNADRIVIGADNERVSLRATALFRDRFPKTPIIRTNPTVAEFGKYTANCFLSAKVIFANEMYEGCERFGISWEDVKKVVASDKRIGESHLDVTSERGFGGKCFPKDVMSFIGLFKDIGIDVSFLEAVWNKNLKIRKIRDWESIPFVKSD